MKTVSFVDMADMTAEDAQIISEAFSSHARVHLADQLLDILRSMRGPTFGYRVDRYRHSLQSATRALRNGEKDEMVVAALLHDVGDPIAPENHSAVAAEILRPYVAERTHWIISHHGLFQGYYYFHHVGKDRNARDKYRGHPAFQQCVDFCEKWDQESFDPDYDTPERLKAYGARFRAQPWLWTFVTGPIDELKKIIGEGFKISMGREEGAAPDDILSIFHGTKLVLVDRTGGIRGYYDADKAGVDRLLVEAGILANVTASPARRKRPAGP